LEVPLLKIILIFIDGFGLGSPDENTNPFYKANIPFLMKQLTSPTLVTVDTSMGVPGLPQSATNQTSLFTGVNAAEILGRHLSGQPTETLRKIIYKDNLFLRLKNLKLTVTYANVYRDEYLRQMADPVDRRLRPSVTSVMCMSAGLPFRTVEDLLAGNGLYHDITGHMLAYDERVKPITPENAAEILYNISRQYDFTLFEHFMTDIIGHKGDMETQVKHLEMLDAFLGKLADMANPKRDIIIITSDHGNIEDASVKTHTLNRVPLILLGEVPEEPLRGIAKITDIMPALLKIVERSGAQ